LRESAARDKSRVTWQKWFRVTTPRENHPTAMPMRQLLLLRHAKSSWDDKTLPDRERPLNPRGRRSAADMRQAMRDLGLAPDMVMLSPSRRTSETLAALEPWDDAPLIEPIEALYLATVAQLLQALHAVPETVRSVMLIGHNPGMHDLAVRLVGPRGMAAAGGQGDVSGAIAHLAAGYPTGALAEFGIAGPWWQLGTGGGQLIRFLRPRDLPQQGGGDGPRDGGTDGGTDGGPRDGGTDGAPADAD
jgi:phosphohistidine phosphatase